MEKQKKRDEPHPLDERMRKCRGPFYKIMEFCVREFDSYKIEKHRKAA